MSDTKEQVLSFFEACTELKKCKFIMATTKIKDILKCIVNSADLYNLFSMATRNYNYLQEKSKCLVTINDGMYNRSYVVMPQTQGNILAFSFCLLVEFDNNTMDFNEFLRRYFPEDGSYFASFHAFCNTIIKGMQEAVAQFFKDELEDSVPLKKEAQEVTAAKAKLLTAIDLAVSEEKQFISTNNKIPEEEKEGALAILTQLYSAVKSGNRSLVTALVCGYNYLVLYYRSVSDEVSALIQLIAEYNQLK